MENNGKQERAVYEQPGILDPDRNVPYNKDTDLRIVTHYNNQSEVYPDTRTSFTDTSANAMQPIEDYALLRGEVKPKVRGSSSGVKITPNIIRNADPMAGGASPEHSKTAYKAGDPGFFTNPLKLLLLTALVTVFIAGEILLLIYLLK